jgi:hypothetical protein
MTKQWNADRPSILHLPPPPPPHSLHFTLHLCTFVQLCLPLVTSLCYQYTWLALFLDFMQHTVFAGGHRERSILISLWCMLRKLFRNELLQVLTEKPNTSWSGKQWRDEPLVFNWWNLTTWGSLNDPEIAAAIQLNSWNQTVFMVCTDKVTGLCNSFLAPVSVRRVDTWHNTPPSYIT